MWRNNGLSIVLLMLFVLSLAGHSVAGWMHHNNELREHGRPSLSWVAFLRTSEFGESVFENWESEFLQMAMYVVLTIFLFQRGSAESKKGDGTDPVDEDPDKHRHDPDAPFPVRRGGWLLTLYRNSLGLAFAILFLVSMLLHAAAGAARHNDNVLEHGGTETVTVAGYLASAQFWYESFQNWQSEFLAVLSIVVLSIHLRQWGSPESKPVHASHAATGE